jgi:hypothetical protein
LTAITGGREKRCEGEDVHDEAELSFAHFVVRIIHPSREIVVSYKADCIFGRIDGS